MKFTIRNGSDTVAEYNAVSQEEALQLFKTDAMTNIIQNARMNSMTVDAYKDYVNSCYI
jgi:hypothetical protein